MLYFGLQLTKLARSKRTSVRLSHRARIVLLAAQGLQNKDIAEQLGVGRVQVSRWRERYVQFGLGGIERDMPRGAPPVKVDVQKHFASLEFGVRCAGRPARSKGCKSLTTKT